MNLVLQVKEKALEIVRTRGPILPVQITKELGVNVLMAGALLSELVDNKSLLISNTKIGGSPMYYVSGQEAKLQSLRDKLNDKQQQAFDMLKRETILQDSKQEPVIRQSLRDMKDFAVPLQVTRGSVQEIFWKWYLVSNEEAEPLIKEILISQEKKQKERDDEIAQQLKEMESKFNRVDAVEPPREIKPIEQRPIEQRVKEEIAKPVEKEKVAKVRKPREIKPVVAQQPIQMQIEPTSTIDEDDEFMMKILNYFKQNKIQYDAVSQIRKESDFEAIVTIPTPVGVMTHFCKAKNKQKINDADLSLLFVQAQMKKMPVLLMTTGDLTKKAQELLQKEFKTITVKKI